jgi:DNA-binding PadR family transcriptional regulator
MSGYEIKQLFDKSISFLWRFHMSQIYPALSKLREEGLVELELVPQAKKPTKKVYSITRKGRRALQGWLREPIPQVALRELFPLKIFFARNVEPEVLRGHLVERMEGAQAQLALYRDLEQLFTRLWEEEPDAYPREDIYYWLLALRWVALREEGIRTWCQEVLQELEKARRI